MQQIISQIINSLGLFSFQLNDVLCINIFASQYLIMIVLTAHSWQKWKRVYPTCPCHKIYGDEAVGLKSCKNTWKITIFVKMWNLGKYRENLVFCQ